MHQNDARFALLPQSVPFGCSCLFLKGDWAPAALFYLKLQAQKEYPENWGYKLKLKVHNLWGYVRPALTCYNGV